MRKEGNSNAYAKSELEKASILQNIKISFMRPTKMLATEFVVIVSIEGRIAAVDLTLCCLALPPQTLVNTILILYFAGLHPLGQLRLGNPLPLPEQRSHRLQSSLWFQHPSSGPGPTSTRCRRHPSNCCQPDPRQTLHAIRETKHGKTWQTYPRSSTLLRSSWIHHFLRRYVLVRVGIEERHQLDCSDSWVGMCWYRCL